MYELTFLKGIKPGYSAAKTFQVINGKRRKISDYNIGQTFSHCEVKLPFIHQALADQLIKRGDAGWFHIYGKPKPNLMPRVYRRKEFFPEVPTRLLVLDIDKYTLTVPWTTPTQVIIEVLKLLGLDVLASSNFTYVLSSSQLDIDILSAHVYFFLDTAVTLRELRQWAMIMNKAIGQKVIDEAVFKSVQPIYVSPPTCIGFVDPFKGSRIGYHEPAPGQFVPLAELKKLGFTMNKIPAPNTALMPMQFKSMAESVEKQNEGMKKNWLDSVEAFVGTDRGINKPAFRAAAQMVAEEGTDTVRDNIDHYVKVFHGEMWKAIHKHGKRGTQDDLDVYDENKARNYIESALDKEFGKQADQLGSLVTAAIDKAVAANSPAPLVSREVLRAAARLQRDHFSKWTEIRSDLKNRASKLIPIGAFEKQSKLVGTSTTHNPISVEQPEKAAEAVVRKLTLMIDSFDREYIYYANKNSPLGYTLVAKADPNFTGIMASFFYDSIGGPTQPSVKKIFEDYLFARIASKSGMNIKENVRVGRRFFQDGGEYYFRAGAFGDKDITVVITEAGVRYEKTIDTPVYWHGIGGLPVTIPSKADLSKAFGVDKPTVEQCRQYLWDRIGKFIASDPASIPALITLAVSLMVKDPQVYHGLFEGGTGTGKTYGATVFKQLFDPTDHDSTINLNKVSDMNKAFNDADYTTFMNNDVTAYDNVREVRAQTQSVMSQLSTGTTKERRIYFTQLNTKMHLSQCLILTSTGNPITETDLANRCINVSFNKSYLTGNNYPVSDFLEAAPIIRHCWFKLVSEFLRVREELKKKVTMHIREFNMAIVESIMDKSIQLTHDDKAKREELIDKLVIKVTEAGRRKKFEDLDVDPMVKIFIAFLDSHSDAELLMQSADRWADFQAWVRQNNGQKKPIEFEAGSGEVNIDMMEIPVSIKAFDTVMGSASANIDVVSQWSYIKLTSPIRYKYTHKIRSLF